MLALAFASASFGRIAWADAPIEVEVHGDPLAPPPKDPSAAGSVIREDRLRAPGLSAGDVLRTQPGVAVLDTGGFGALSTASIRGATAAQTPVYLAGVRLNDDVAGSADLSTVPLWLLHRVEIYRSNAPLEGDQLGIGGAIFFEPRRPHGDEGSVGEMAGSFGARSYFAHAGVGGERAAVLVGVRYQGATNDYGYLDDGGVRFDPGQSHVAQLTNADAHALDIWALGTLALGAEGRADLVFNAVARGQGLPLALFPSHEARLSQSRQLAAVTTRLPCGKSGCEITTTTSVLFSQAAYDDPLREVALGTTHLDVAGSRVEEALLARWPITASLRLVPSVRVAVEQLALLPLDGAALHAERGSGRVALGGEWDVSSLVTVRATGSGECDGTSVSGAVPWALPGSATGDTAGGRVCSTLEPSARLGVTVGRRPLTFLVNAGRYARVPTLAELYGLSGAVRGNEALTPEHGISADAGVRAAAPPSWHLGDAAVDLFGFARYADDLIAYQTSSLGYVRPYNVGAARVLGAELAATASPVRFVRVDLSATVQDPRDVSPGRTLGNDLLPYQPRLILTPRVEFRAPLPSRTVPAMKLAAAYFYEAARYADPAGTEVLPAQGSLDLEGELELLSGHLVLRGRVANLLDQPRFDFIGYPLPGRAGYLTLEARW